MAVVVQKYGGTSVDGPERLRAVAARTAAVRAGGDDLIVVVSAMGRTTDEMHRLARAVHPDPPRRELDMLVTAGERVAMSLLAMAIHARGHDVISLTGSQSGIITDTEHGNARIREVRAHRIREALEAGRIVIVAGYQGVSTAREVTTLGRGGSDLTALALADAFDAVRCELLKDVDGIMTADPAIVPDARRLESVPMEALLALVRAGSPVLHEGAVRHAAEKNRAFTVRSSLHEGSGTEVTTVSLDQGALVAVTARPSFGGATAVTLVGGASRLDGIASDPPALRGAVAPARTGPLALTWTFDDDAGSAAAVAAVHALFLAEPRAP